MKVRNTKTNEEATLIYYGDTSFAYITDKNGSTVLYAAKITLPDGQDEMNLIEVEGYAIVDAKNHIKQTFSFIPLN